jgi:hypothetical protein
MYGRGIEIVSTQTARFDYSVAVRHRILVSEHPLVCAHKPLMYSKSAAVTDATTLCNAHLPLG